MQPSPSPWKKVIPLFPSNPSLKVEVLSRPPFLKIWLEVQPPLLPPPAERGGGYTLWTMLSEHLICFSFKWFQIHVFSGYRLGHHQLWRLNVNYTKHFLLIFCKHFPMLFNFSIFLRFFNRNSILRPNITEPSNWLWHMRCAVMWALLHACLKP